MKRNAELVPEFELVQITSFFMIDNEEETKKTFFNFKFKFKFKWPPWDLEILKPVKPPKSFWHLNSEDLRPIGLMLFSIVAIWVFCAIFSTPTAPMDYWDGPNYLYAAITLYNIPKNNPWTIYFSYPQSYFACHLPGYPILIRIISTFVFNCFQFGYIITIILVPLLFVYVFRRLLIIYKCVKDPTWSATLLAIFPIRFVIYHSTGASEPLFMLLIALGMIFFKIEKPLQLCLCICGCCITRVEGIIVWGTFGLCYLLRFDIKKAFYVGCCLISFGLLILFHYIKFGEYDAYLKFNQGQQRIISRRFFDEMRFSPKWGWSPLQFESIIPLYIPFFFGIFLCYTNHLPYAILGTAYFIFISILNHLDIYRYALPGFLPTLIIGFDSLFSSKQFRIMSPIIISLILSFEVFYATNQINCNRAPDFFMADVYKEPTHYFR